MKISQLDSSSLEQLFLNYNANRGDYRQLAVELLQDIFSDDLFNKIDEDENTLVVNIESQESFAKFIERLLVDP